MDSTEFHAMFHEAGGRVDGTRMSFDNSLGSGPSTGLGRRPGLTMANRRAA